MTQGSSLLAYIAQRAHCEMLRIRCLVTNQIFQTERKPHGQTLEQCCDYWLTAKTQLPQYSPSTKHTAIAKPDDRCLAEIELQMPRFCVRAGEKNPQSASVHWSFWLSLDLCDRTKRERLITADVSCALMPCTFTSFFQETLSVWTYWSGEWLKTTYKSQLTNLKAEAI